jgi:mRNA interferase RelE/StbE
MNYELDFHPAAWKEWQALDSTIREQFKQKLAERLKNPHHAPSKLSGQKSTLQNQIASNWLSISL